MSLDLSAQVSPLPKRAPALALALAGVLGVFALGASFTVLPQTPNVGAPLSQLVSFAHDHHTLLLWVAWLEAAGDALFVAFVIGLANLDEGRRSVARALSIFVGSAVLGVGLLYAVSVIMFAQSAAIGGSQLESTAVAYGLFAACEHAFLLAPPVLLPVGFALRGSRVIGRGFSAAAITLGSLSIVVGLVGLFYAKPNTGGPAGLAVNVLIGLESLWVLTAALSLYQRSRRQR